jgi:hypothetical protein
MGMATAQKWLDWAGGKQAIDDIVLESIGGADETKL